MNKQSLEKILSAAGRAISGIKSFKTTPKDEQQLAILRGETDKDALFLRYHNSNLTPTLGNSIQAKILEKCEIARVEAIGSFSMQGVKSNIASYLENYAIIQGYNQITGHEYIPLDDIVYFILRSYFSSSPHPKMADELMQKYGDSINSQIKNLLPLLKENLTNQQKFQDICLKLIDELNINSVKKERNITEIKEADEEVKHTEEGILAEKETKPTKQESSESVEANTSSAESSESATIEPSSQSKRKEIFEQIYTYPEYKIYTNKFDEIVAAEKLSTSAELSLLRQQLDRKLADLKNITQRSANKLLRKLMAREKRSFEFNEEEGIIDTKKLTQLIINPTYKEYFKKENIEHNLDTVVTLLIDNSGSMRGRPITIAAMSADILAKTLERCGIKVEILGFTTAEWRGGKSHKLWVTEGRPKNPGRLNDLRHIIYKAADTPWQKAKRNLGLMLRDGILKENIDGEALLWAYGRLAKRPEQRKILLIISDGAPVDDSTLSTNPGPYLDRHLQDTIHWLENYSNITLLAIGIGHDVTQHYSNAVTIQNAEQLGDNMFKKLGELLK
jgi:cobaltochelatase CobT